MSQDVQNFVDKCASLLKNNKIIIKQILCQANQDNQPLPICFQIEDKLVGKDYLIQVVQLNDDIPNCTNIQIAPLIVKKFILDEIQFVQQEYSSISLQEYLLQAQKDCVSHRFLDILIQLTTSLDDLVSRGYILQSLSAATTFLRLNRSVVVSPFSIVKLDSEKQQSFIDQQLTPFLFQLSQMATSTCEVDAIPPTSALNSCFVLLESLWKSSLLPVVNLQDVIASVRTQIKTFVKFEENTFFLQAKDLTDKGETNEAIQCLNILTFACPHNYQVFFQLGKAYKQIHNLDNSLKAFKESVGINPLFYEGYIEIGQIYLYDLMEIDKASEYFVKAIDLDGMNDSAFFYLGYCYLNKNNLDKARCMYEKCLQINPHHSLALLDLGWASYLQGDITEAVHYYNKSLVINPNVDSTLLNLVNCMIMQEKKEETCYLIERISSLQGLVDYTHRLIVLDPLNSYLYHDLGIISMIKGDLHKALISFQKCLEININYIYKGFLLSQILLLNNCI